MSVMIATLLLLAAALVAASPAHAYVDPGTGSLAVQGIIAAILGVGLTVKLTWRRIRARLTGKPSRDEGSDADR